MAFENILNPVFAPLLQLPSVVSILIIAFGITLLTTLAYKYLTDQKKMKVLKAEMKTYQAKIKKLSKENPDKAMKIQQEMMGKNMELMKHSFKPMLYTFIPLIIIFGWLNAHMAYLPLEPGVPFDVTVQMQNEVEGVVAFSSIPALQVSKDDTAEKNITDGEVSWTLRGEAGEYELSFTHSDVIVTKDVIISPTPGDYAQPTEKLKEDSFKQIIIGNEKIHPLEGWPLVGNWGWLGIYIIFSIAISISLRKLLKVN